MGQQSFPGGAPSEFQQKFTQTIGTSFKGFGATMPKEPHQNIDQIDIKCQNQDQGDSESDHEEDVGPEVRILCKTSYA